MATNLLRGHHFLTSIVTKLIDRKGDGSEYADLFAVTLYGSNDTELGTSANPLQQNLATAIAGEDLTNNVLKVEQRFSYIAISTAVTTTVKATSGFLHTITIVAAGASGNTVTVYDNTAGSGTAIIPTFTPVVGTLLLDVSFGTGLTIVTAGTTPPILTVSYR